MDPLVSIIIPSSDRLELLDVAVKSVISQSYSNIEIVVVDDCSVVPIKNIWADCGREIIIHRNDNKFGGAISRNAGVSVSSGEFIGFLDDDDYYYNNKISDLMREFSSNQQLDVVFGQIIKKSQPEPHVDLSLLSNNNIIGNNKFIKYLHTNTSLIKREVFDSIRFDEQLGKFQDTQLHLELVNKAICKYIKKPVAFWNDNHGLKQITNMITEDNYLRSLHNFMTLKENLKKRSSISLNYYIYLSIKYQYMVSKYNHKFNKKVAEQNILVYYFYKLSFPFFKIINRS